MGRIRQLAAYATIILTIIKILFACLSIGKKGTRYSSIKKNMLMVSNKITMVLELSLTFTKKMDKS